MERALASIRKIGAVNTHPNADKLALYQVDGWQVCDQIGSHKVGDMIVYFEIDSYLPLEEKYEFLRKYAYKTMGEKEGLRIKTIRLRGEYSQGLIMSLDILPSDYTPVLGDDVTELLNVDKYEKPISAQLAGVAKGNFPSVFQKTNENRIQNIWNKLSKYELDRTYTKTEKLDGSSTTHYLNEGVFGVCSRNLDLKRVEDTTNSFWLAAIELDVEAKMRSMFTDTDVVCFQGELIGEGVQGNRYKVQGREVRYFNGQKNGVFFTKSEFHEIMDALGLPTVPILEKEATLPETLKELIESADGKSVLNKNTTREGFVYVSDKDPRVSFKVISNKFLLKNE